MNIEQISAPLPEPSPQMRYASLHRAVEQGMANDATWRDLVKVCVELGLHDEARQAFSEVFDPFEQKRLRSLLIRHRILGPEEAAPASEPAPKVFVETTSFAEEAADALRFLFLDHMPLTVVVATLTFPLVVGLGGLLTAGSPLFVFPAIAMLPGLTVLGIVGALGRRILLESSQGIDDPPRIPEAGVLFHEAGRFLVDAAVLLALLLGPGIAMLVLPAPPVAAIAALLLGAMLLPMALVLRQLRNDWQALAPRLLFPAVVRGGTPYLGAALVIAGLFLPAALAGAFTLGSQFYLQVSVIGPLVVAPLFVSARLLGRTVALRRDQLGMLLTMPVVAAKAAAPRASATPAPAEPRVAPAPRSRTNLRGPAHPEARQSQPNPTRARTAAPAPAPRPESGVRPAAPATPAATPRPAAPRPASPRPASPRPAAPAAPRPAAPQPTAAPAPRLQTIVGEAPPDLTKLPGVNVVTGKARQLVGAAAPTRVETETPDDPPPPIPLPKSKAPVPAPAKPVQRPPIRRRD